MPLLDTNECILEAERSLTLGKPIHLRNSGRSLCDFARVSLSQMGDQFSGHAIVRELSIKKRFQFLSSLIPELMDFKSLFLEIDEMRNKLEHDENIIPTPDRLAAMLDRAMTFNQMLNIRILPGLKVSGKTAQDKFRKEWKEVLALKDVLDGYSASGHADKEDMDIDFKELADIDSHLDDINNESIHEARVKIKALQVRIEKKIEDGELQRKIDYYEAMADSYG